MSNTHTTCNTVAVLEPADTPIFDEFAEHFRTIPTRDELDHHFRTLPVDIAPRPATIDAQIVEVRDVPTHDTTADDLVVETKASKAESALWCAALAASIGAIVWLNNLLEATAIA
ncbi:hypothetical protein ACLBYD_27130 [Rhodococcus sp. C26F]